MIAEFCGDSGGEVLTGAEASLVEMAYPGILLPGIGGGVALLDGPGLEGSAEQEPINAATLKSRRRGCPGPILTRATRVTRVCEAFLLREYGIDPSIRGAGYT